MSQDYDTVMKLPVQVTGVPDDVRVTMPAESQISVSLSGKGSALRKSGRRGGKHTLQVHSGTFNMSQGHASLSTQRLRDSVSALLPANVSIRDIEPDSLVFQYALQRSVMLPVVFDGTTESQDQFFLERIEFQPESIEAKVLLSDTVAHRVLADIGNISISSDTTVLAVSVKPVPGVLLSTSEVRMTVIAQQYTEKSI